MPTISTADLAKNTVEILDAVANHGETITVERNQTVIAQIIPAKKSMTASQALEGLKLPFMTINQGKIGSGTAREILINRYVTHGPHFKSLRLDYSGKP